MHENKLEELKNILRKSLDVKNSLVFSGESPRLKRTLQHFLELKLEDKKLQTLLELVLRHAIQAEDNCPGAGLVVLRLFCSTKIASTLIDEKPRPTYQEISSSFDNVTSSSLIRDVLKSILLNCSRETKITLGKSSNSNLYLEILEGHSFYVKSLLKSPSLLLNNAKVSCIDGYIENVSELHRLLTDLSETKDNCLLFCRGMSNDVLHTIKVNNDRKTINMLPFLVAYDIENVNTLVDIATVSNTDVISSTKGDLITSVSLENLGNVSRTSIHSENVVMTSMARAKKRIDIHLENIKNTMKERPEIEDVLSKRLKSLSSENICVYLPDDINYYSHRQQIDEGIRIIMSHIKNSYEPKRIAQYFFDRLEASLENLEF